MTEPVDGEAVLGARGASPLILITGADGQIGWEARRAFAPLGRIVAARRGDIDLAKASAIRDVVRHVRPDVIVNAAAYTAVDRAESEPDLAFAVNAEAPRVLAAEAVASGALLVHYSTDYVFDGSNTAPYTEWDEPDPSSVYGASKLAGDRAVLASGARHLIFRTSWVYGVRRHNFMLTMLRLARERDELTVVDDQTGTPTPAALIASTTAAIVAQVTAGGEEAASASRWGVYNLVARGATTWHAFTRRILTLDPHREEQRCARVTPIGTADYPTAARRPAYSVLDPTKLERTFGLRMPEWESQLELLMRSLARR